MCDSNCRKDENKEIDAGRGPVLSPWAKHVKLRLAPVLSEFENVAQSQFLYFLH